MKKFHFLTAVLLGGVLTSAVSFAASENLADYKELKRRVRETLALGEVRTQEAVEREKVRTSWEIGKLIDEHILLHKERADYGEQVIKRLADDLGISKRELHYLVEFARTYRIVPTSAQLSWGHYRDLLAVNDPEERSKVERFAEEHKLPLAELRKEIKRRRLATAEDSSIELPEITPGPLYTYQIIRLKDHLKIDLGFGIYLSVRDDKIPTDGTWATGHKYHEGDIVTLEKGKLKKTEKAQPAKLFTYQAQVTQVVDGDTFHALIDLGFGITLAQRVRLRRIDAPEIFPHEMSKSRREALGSPETSVKNAGLEAKAYLEKILSRDQGRILMKSIDIDQHGRPIADVWTQGKPIDQELLDEGLAVRMSE